MSRPQPFPGHAATTAAPGLEFRYAAADTLPRQLADDRVLAVLGFGSSAPANDDPRWLRVPLQPLGAGAPALPLVAFVTRQQRRLEARRRAKEAARLDKAYRHGGAA